MPHVLELSFGVDRNILSLFEIFFEEEKERAIFRFPHLLAPYDAAVFPLVNKDKLPEIAKDVKELLRDFGLSIFYDDSGSIGRRYRRMDEIGVPASITIDNQTLEDGTVTIRDRDSMKQVRVKKDDLCTVLKQFLAGEDIEKLGKVIS